MVENLENIIYEKLTDNVDDITVANDIYNDITNLETVVSENYKIKINKLSEEVNKVSEKLNKVSEELNKVSKELDKKNDELDETKRCLNLSFHHILIIRQALNRLFKCVYENNKNDVDKINDLDKLIYECQFIKKKRHLTNNKDIKMAISILYDKFICPYISKNMCEYYLKINDEMHPIPKPPEIIYESIHELLRLANKNQKFNILGNLKLKTLEDIEISIKAYENIFKMLNN